MKNQVIPKLLVTGIVVLFTTLASAQHRTPWNVPDDVKTEKNPYASDESSKARGKNTYKTECQRCHGKQGKGNGTSADLLDIQVADLSSAKVQSQTDGELFWKISEGRKPMPLSKTTLTDDQRWDIINFIRTFKSK